MANFKKWCKDFWDRVFLFSSVKRKGFSEKREDFAEKFFYVERNFFF